MKTVFFSCLVLMCVLSIGSSAQRVTVDPQRGNDFSKYKTYAWGVSQHPIRDPVWNQRIIMILDDELMRKGLTKVSPDAAPSLIVVYNASVKQDVSLEGSQESNENSTPKVWAGWCGPCRDLAAVVDKIGKLHHGFRKQVTLLVDLADPQHKMVIWHGMARELPFDESRNNIEKLQKMVAKMFKDYPTTNELASLVKNRVSDFNARSVGLLLLPEKMRAWRNLRDSNLNSGRGDFWNGNMKAALIHYYGGPERMRFQDARTWPSSVEVLISAHSAGINSFNSLSCSGKGIFSLEPMTR